MPNRQIAKFFGILPVLLLYLAACGGGTAPQTPLTNAESSFQTPSAALAQSDNHAGVDWKARRDYKEAMVLDCREEGGSRSTCSTSGLGWFERWYSWPRGVIYPKDTLTSNEKELIWRAVAIVNRSLPADKRLKLYVYNATGRSLERHYEGSISDRLKRRLSSGYIHTEILSLGRSRSAGVGWTDGNKAYALTNSDRVSHPEGIVDVMVHEILHALGLRGHPHHVHTSLLSYRHEPSDVLDNIPLIDIAVLYDMYGWGRWTGRVATVFDKVDGVQFGVHDFDNGLALIPWVEGGYMGPPSPSRLTGRASYEGQLVGKTTVSRKNVWGAAELGFNFSRSSGDVSFHTIRHWDGTMWNRQGYRYDLNMSDHYFRSSITDGNSPDVVGAFYGYDGEVAAGTLQRADLTAAFGASKN